MSLLVETQHAQTTKQITPYQTKPQSYLLAKNETNEVILHEWGNAGEGNQFYSTKRSYRAISFPRSKRLKSNVTSGARRGRSYPGDSVSSLGRTKQPPRINTTPPLRTKPNKTILLFTGEKQTTNQKRSLYEQRMILYTTSQDVPLVVETQHARTTKPTVPHQTKTVPSPPGNAGKGTTPGTPFLRLLRNCTMHTARAGDAGRSYCMSVTCLWARTYGRFASRTTLPASPSPRSCRSALYWLTHNIRPNGRWTFTARPRTQAPPAGVLSNVRSQSCVG